MAENINALLARGVGPAMVEGAQAGYYSSRTRHEDEQERRRLAVQPDIPLALKGDMDAYGRVAGADPKAGLLVATEMQRIEDAKRKKQADAVAWSADAADAILKAAPAERPALWKTLYQQGVSLGHDMSQTPPDWHPGLESDMRTIRERAVPYLERWKAQKQLELKRTPPGKNAPAGAGAFDKPSWGGPAPNIPVEPSAAPDQSSALPDNGPVVASAEPPGVATGQATAQPDTQAAPVQTAQAAPTAPPGWQAMGHRDPQGNLVPALMDGKPVYRNVQTGELTSQPPVQEGVPELSSGGTGPQGPGGALPPGVQVAQAGPPNRAAPVPAAPGAVVHEIPPGYEPVRQQGIPFVNKQGYIPLISQNGPPILLKPADQKTQKKMIDVFGADGKTLIGQRNPDTNEYRPVNQPAQGDEIDPTLRGDELLATLSPTEAAQVKAVWEGRDKLPSLSSRMAPEAKRLRTLVFQYDPTFDGTVYASRQKTQNDMADGKLATNISNANKLIGHLGELYDVSEKLNNSSTPLFNKVGNLIAANRGDPRIAEFEATKHLVLEEADKFFSGTGGTTVSGMEEWRKKINDAQSPQQLQGVMTQITKLLNSQLDAMANQYNNGMKFTGDKRIKPESLLSENAKAGIEKVRSNALVKEKGGADATDLYDIYGLARPQ